MTINQQRLYKLLTNPDWSPEDEQWMTSYVLQEDYSDWKDTLHELFKEDQEKKIDPLISARIQQRLVERIQVDDTIPQRVHKMRKTNWLRYAVAASLILIIGSGIYYLNNQSYQSQKSHKSQFRQETQADIPPGSNKAIWTLSDGQQIELDSTILDMTAKKQQLENTGYNELRTPRGGQYQLILPDGSKVWLNAASSIRYPVAFNSKERKVEITGEAYFEIAKDASKPFKVYSGEQQIEVLGTSFNINVYDDEPTKKTTLITGSIKITNNNQTAILKPGQQANVSITPITKIKQITVQTEEVIAWKNGIFHFDNQPLQEIMRQIQRWYNIEIEYPNGIPAKTISGEMGRDLYLTEMIELLKDLRVDLALEGNKLIIYNK